MQQNNQKFSAKLRSLIKSKSGSSTIILSKHNAASWYSHYLLMMHSIIRSTIPLMRVALHSCIGLPEEKLIAELRNYYKKHIEEEMNHDEQVLDDLESIGIARQESLSQKPSQGAAASCLLARLYFVLRS